MVVDRIARHNHLTEIMLFPICKTNDDEEYQEFDLNTSI